jgi:hypothetical protein
VIFEVLNGSSDTWGSFGAAGELLSSVPTTLTNLNEYSPEASVGNSGVGFSKNRVQFLKLVRVRYHLASGEVIEDGTVRTVYEE